MVRAQHFDEFCGNCCMDGSRGDQEWAVQWEGQSKLKLSYFKESSKVIILYLYEHIDFSMSLILFQVENDCWILIIILWKIIPWTFGIVKTWHTKFNLCSVHTQNFPLSNFSISLFIYDCCLGWYLVFWSLCLGTVDWRASIQKCW